MTSALGIFLSRDPYPGSLTSPASQNGYGYVHGNPANFTDPTGMQCFDIWNDDCWKEFKPALRQHLIESSRIWNDISKAPKSAGAFVWGFFDEQLDFLYQPLFEVSRFLAKLSCNATQAWWDFKNLARSPYQRAMYNQYRPDCETPTYLEAKIGVYEGIGVGEEYVTAREDPAFTGGEATAIAIDLFPIVRGIGRWGFRRARGFWRASDEAIELAPEVTTIADDFVRPTGAKGPSSGRTYDPTKIGGPIRELNYENVRVTQKGVDYVELHTSRFYIEGDPATYVENDFMIDRLRRIASGDLEPKSVDLRYYTHELREFVRYRQLGYRTGQPSNVDEAYDLWNNAHTATLEDYRLNEKKDYLYHPDAIRKLLDIIQ